MTDCNHPSLAQFREDDVIMCLLCRKEWSRDEAVEQGLLDKVNYDE